MQQASIVNANQAGTGKLPPSLLPEMPVAGTRKAVFALTEGDVVISFPEELSPESVNDLSDYIDIFLKKARREAGVSPKTTSSND